MAESDDDILKKDVWSVLGIEPVAISQIRSKAESERQNPACLEQALKKGFKQPYWCSVLSFLESNQYTTWAQLSDRARAFGLKAAGAIGAPVHPMCRSASIPDELLGKGKVEQPKQRPRLKRKPKWTWTREE